MRRDWPLRQWLGCLDCGRRATTSHITTTDDGTLLSTPIGSHCTHHGFPARLSAWPATGSRPQLQVPACRPHGAAEVRACDSITSCLPHQHAPRTRETDALPDLPTPRPPEGSARRLVKRSLRSSASTVPSPRIFPSTDPRSPGTPPV